LLAGDAFAEPGMEPVIAGVVTSHGDTVLITGLGGEALALDRDTVVELLRRPSQAPAAP
jgi:hypothetical protein